MPAALIAAGKTHWVDSAPGDALLNAIVDIGTMKQIGDEYEALLRWPPTPAFPRQSFEVARVICTPHREISYTVTHWRAGPKGQKIGLKQFVADTERKMAEAHAAGDYAMKGIPPRYGPNPRSLVCWAAARKCEGKPFSWPPPPNKAPLNDSEEARKMRDAYNAQFFPKCRLR